MSWGLLKSIAIPYDRTLKYIPPSQTTRQEHFPFTANSPFKEILPNLSFSESHRTHLLCRQSHMPKKKPLVLEVTSLRRYHDRTANTVFCLPFLLPKQSIVRQISTSSARQYPSKSFFTPEAQSHIHCRSETLRAAILDPANPSGLFELRSIISSSFYDKPTAVPRTFHIQTPSFVLRMQYPRNNHCV
jgi:hypothetical protein